MSLASRSVNWSAGTATVALVAIVGWHVFAPMPGEHAARKTRSVQELSADKERARRALAQTEAGVDSLTWKIDRDAIAPAAMALVSKKAQASLVSVSAFRPQRTLDANGLDQLSYLVTAQGPFLDVMRFVKAFEAKGSLVAVKAVQIGSIDGTSDAVRATLTLVAYAEDSNDGG